MEKTIEIPEGYEARIKGNKVIPELKESEDEKMIRIIEDAICTNEAQQLVKTKYGLELTNLADWLEKQKENPRTADSIPLDCTSDVKYENRWHKVGDSLPDNAREVVCKDAIGNFFIGRYYNDGDYWEVSMYDEPDKSNGDNPPVLMWMNIPSCEQVLANSAKTCKDEQEPTDNIESSAFKDKLLELFQKFRWFKKDVPTNGDIIEYVDAHIQELINTIQNPAWSEEDEHRITDTIYFLESAKKHYASTEELQNCIGWLEFLKERYTWEPSDEQMEALDDFIYAKYPNVEKHGIVVKSLYQDLKKLKG